MDGPLHRPRTFVALLAAALLALVALAPTAALADDDAATDPAAAAATLPDTSTSTPAATWPTGGSTLHLLLQMGTEHWGMTPCGGKVSIRWGTLDPSINAQSSWVNPVDDYAQPSRNTDCQVTLSTGTWWDWPKLCTVTIHEIGHLTGHQHVDDPTDIMYFAYVQPAPECVSTPEPVETGPPPTVPRAVATVAPKPAVAAAKKPTVAKRKAIKKTKGKKHRR